MVRKFQILIMICNTFLIFPTRVVADAHTIGAHTHADPVLHHFCKTEEAAEKFQGLLMVLLLRVHLAQVVGEMSLFFYVV